MSNWLDHYEKEFKVGDDVSWSAGTDTHCGQVVEVKASSVRVVGYGAKLLNGPGSGEPDALTFSPGGFCGHTSGEQRYEFTLREDTGGKIFTRRKAMGGVFKERGISSRGSMRGWGILYLGQRHHYDFNF